MMTELLLPDLGEGICSGTLIAVLVTPGRPFTAGETLFEIETDKVSVEIPAPADGVIDTLYVQQGDEVRIGDRLAAISPVDTGAGGQATGEQRQTTAAPLPRGAAIMPQASTPTSAPATGFNDLRHPVPAGPAARRMARVLGIDIGRVPGSGVRGRISKQDVQLFAKRRLQGNDPEGQALGQSSLPDLAPFGVVESRPLKRIQRTTARNISRAWREIPHAWMQEEIDVTTLEQRRRQQADRDDATAPLTLTPFLIKAMATSLQHFPLFNASIDMTSQRIVQRHYIDIGVAVDTPRGLIVPVIRGVQTLDPGDIARVLAELSVRAHANQLRPDELQGAGITLSNLGNMGLCSIYPIINWPQSSIVGTAAARWRQRRDPHGNWRERLLLPLTLAFDHRLINGADGARFVAHLKTLLEQPDRLLER